VNTGARWPSPSEAKVTVLGMQTKLHRWARADATRRFDDLYNLVYDPAFLVVAWTRVRGNTGARSPGVDGQTARVIEQRIGVEAFLQDVRGALKSRTFRPLPVRERMIPKPGGSRRRRLGIPTVADRVVQAALKLVLEPIFEADFKPVRMGSARDADPTTRSPRSTTSPATATAGCWKPISRRASTKSRMSVSWTGCEGVSETTAWWVWSRRSSSQGSSRRTW